MFPIIYMFPLYRSFQETFNQKTWNFNIDFLLIRKEKSAPRSRLKKAQKSNLKRQRTLFWKILTHSFDKNQTGLSGSKEYFSN